MKNLILLFALMVLTMNIEARPLHRTLLKKFRKLQAITKCSYIVTSGYRSKAHNKRVGGVKNSFHLTGRALDIVPHRGCNIPLKTIAHQAVRVGFNGVILYKRHIHVDIGLRIFHEF